MKHVGAYMDDQTVTLLDKLATRATCSRSAILRQGVLRLAEEAKLIARGGQGNDQSNRD